MVLTWKTRNIRSLFPLKDKNDYKSCVIYKGDCSCGSRYIGENKRNAGVRWNEHNIRGVVVQGVLFGGNCPGSKKPHGAIALGGFSWGQFSGRY